MSTDLELDNWRRQWQGGPDHAAQAQAAEELRRRVLRDTRRIKLMLVMPALVTVAIGGFVVLRALRTGQVIDLVLAIETWLFIIVVWIGSLWLGRGTWRPLGDTTAAFLDVSIRRCEANLGAASFAAYLYGLQLLFVVLAKVIDSAAGFFAVLTSLPMILLGWLGLPLFYAGIHWYRRRQRAELEHLRELRRQLGSD